MAYSVENDQMHPQDRMVEEMKTANILKAIEIILAYYRNDKRLRKLWNGEDVRRYLVQIAEGKTISADGLFTCMEDRENAEKELRKLRQEWRAERKAEKGEC